MLTNYAFFSLEEWYEIQIHHIDFHHTDFQNNLAWTRLTAQYLQMHILLIGISQHIGVETKSLPVHRRHIQVHFLERKRSNFKLNVIEIWSLWSDWQYGSIGSDNGLAPTRRQAIIRSNVVMMYVCWYVYMHHSTSMSLRFRVWITNYMYKQSWDVFTHPCHNCNGGFAELPMNLTHWLVIAYSKTYGM